MNKITALVLLFFFIPAIALADPQIAPLNKYQKAPFSGVLYNSEAIAEMVAWKDTLIQQHQLALDQLRASLNAECSLQVNNLQAEVDACNDRYGEMLGIKNQQIIKLEELALERSNSYSVLWLGGGIIIGVLTTIGIVYVTK